jgi:hypothetical protein
MFKTGDRVVLKRKSAGRGWKGLTGTIISAPENDNGVQIQYDKNTGGDKTWWAYTADVEFLVAKPTIVEDTRDYLKAVTEG